MGRNRREFLSEVGRGMLAGSLGVGLAGDLGLARVGAAEVEGDERLRFGKLEPLVTMMQETPLEKLQPACIERMKADDIGLDELVTAGLLANARAFGGDDYTGYHTFMALAPSLHMAGELSGPGRALPVLKVLYRNTERIHSEGGVAREVLKPVTSVPELPAGRVGGEVLREATRSKDMPAAEGVFAALADQPAGEIFNHAQYSVQDAVNVHRVVLAWRAWLAVEFVGEKHAHTLLRQTVRFCVNEEQRQRSIPGIRALLPELLDQYGLPAKETGNRAGDDAWMEELANTVFASTRDQAAGAVAEALAAGFAPDSIGEALSIAANKLLLHDPGRAKDSNGDKVRGTVHGDSVGVHASDAANAWRNIARVGNDRNRVASLIVGAYHTAGQSNHVGEDRWPLKLDAVERQTDASALLHTADEAIRGRDQGLAGAAIRRYGDLGGKARPVFDLMLKYATSEDGALHAEKYYRTVTEEYANGRPAFRWRQLVALARVTASEYGTPAPGRDQARRLLGLG